MELQVTVNGEARKVPERCSVAHLLQLMEVDPARVAVERNRDVIPRREYDRTQLADGDRLEVVTFVGGG